jgi:hypothetical protein
VKRFNLNILKHILLWVLAVVAVLVIWPFKDSIIISDDIHTRRFCAYGTVYVEFEHNNKIWGTIFLGTNGKPVRCTDDDTIPENISTTPITKETI